MQKIYIIVIAMAAILFGGSISLEAQYSGGSGTQSDPYQISSITDLVNLRDSVGDGHIYSDTCFVLTADIDLDTIANWTPIGTTGTSSYLVEPQSLETLYGVFEGNFDGAGHTISNLTINLGSENNAFYVGLFGIVENALIENINMVNTNITDNSSSSLAGSIVGYANATTIRNCTNQGTLEGSAGIGGICGWCFNNAIIENCYNSGIVSGDSFAGGILGNGSISSVTGCVNSASVTVEGEKPNYVGGIGGYATSITMKNCLNLGTVFDANSTYVGGLIGSISSNTVGAASISQSVNAGPVSGSTYTGGICGQTLFSTNSLSIQDCYNIGFVNSQSGSNVGGISGINSGGTFSNCYYDKQMCPVGGINGTDSTGASGVLTVNMVGTFLFNDATNWAQNSNMYPIPIALDTAIPDAALVASTPIFLAYQQTVDKISSDFTVASPSGISYAVTNNVLSISGTEATLLNLGNDTLTLSSANYSKSIPLTIVASTCTFSGTSNNVWTTESNWDEYPSNIDNVVIDSDATLNAQVTIANLTINSGKTLTIQSGGALNVSASLINNGDIVLEQGGQLLQSTNGITASVQYNIEAWTNDPVGGWYTISSPVASQSISAMFGPQQTTAPTNMDLYVYNEPGFNWLNYNAGSISETNMLVGKGYLTAFESDIKLTFNGELNTGGISPISLSHLSTNPDLMGWNLVGNPYPCNIYIGNQATVSSQVSTGYYSVTNGSALVASTNDDAILPCMGFFVEANATDQTITFNNNPPTKETNVDAMHYLSVEVSDESGMDRAFLLFDDAIGLKKMSHLSDDAPVLYIPMNGQKYAIAIVADKADLKQIPLCFKAGSALSYALSLKTKNVDFEYLHLIDNYTGADIDLLQQSHYAFQTAPQYDKNRFSLWFEKADSGSSVCESFAFVSNGILVVEGADDDARLQLIDIRGRIVFDGFVSDVNIEKMNLGIGIYVIRLIQPDQVRTQKIILN